jgi:hypothetical protein
MPTDLPRREVSPSEPYLRLLPYLVILSFISLCINAEKRVKENEEAAKEKLAAFETHMNLADADSNGVTTLEEQFRYFSERFNASHVDTSRTLDGHLYETLSMPCIVNGRRGQYPATVRGGPAVLFPAPDGSYNRPKDFRPKEHNIAYRR